MQVSARYLRLRRFRAETSCSEHEASRSIISLLAGVFSNSYKPAVLKFCFEISTRLQVWARCLRLRRFRAAPSCSAPETSCSMIPRCVFKFLHACRYLNSYTPAGVGAVFETATVQGRARGRDQSGRDPRPLLPLRPRRTGSEPPSL